jgi:hypothetical protein
MGVYRLYSDADGESQITKYTDEELKNIKIKGTMSFSVAKREPGHFMDIHPAASRRWHIHVEGRMTIGLSDGTSHTFNPGDVRLVEDTNGKGHTTTLPDGDTIALMISIDEE